MKYRHKDGSVVQAVQAFDVIKNAVFGDHPVPLWVTQLVSDGKLVVMSDAVKVRSTKAGPWGLAKVPGGVPGNGSSDWIVYSPIMGMAYPLPKAVFEEFYEPLP